MSSATPTAARPRTRTTRRDEKDRRAPQASAGPARHAGRRHVDGPVAERLAERRAEREREPLEHGRRERQPHGVEVRLRDHREPQRVRHALAVRLAVGREPNIVSISDSNCSAGRISQTKCATSSPAFQNLCGVPGGDGERWPGPATSFRRPTLKPTLPRRHLEALLLGRVDVGRGDEAVRLTYVSIDDGLAAGLARGLAEHEPLAGDGVHDAVSCMDHVGVSFWLGWSVETIRAGA